jgi:hypothetical protein
MERIRQGYRYSNSSEAGIAGGFGCWRRLWLVAHGFGWGWGRGDGAEFAYAAVGAYDEGE